jgi:hypothetical protein
VNSLRDTGYMTILCYTIREFSTFRHKSGLGLKQKLSFSYFRENFFRFSRNNESFRENENLSENWRGKWKCREISEFQEANEV